MQKHWTDDNLQIYNNFPHINFFLSFIYVQTITVALKREVISPTANMSLFRHQLTALTERERENESPDFIQCSLNCFAPNSKVI